MPSLDGMRQLPDMTKEAPIQVDLGADVTDEASLLEKMKQKMGPVLGQ